MRLFHRHSKTGHVARGALVGFIVGTCVMVLYASGGLDRAEWRLLDQRFVWRAMVQPAVDFGPVVVLAIDDATLHHIGRWPWPWSEQARLVEAVAEAGAAAIGVDILYPEPDTDADGAAHLAAAIARAGNVVLSVAADEKTRPWPTLAAGAARVGTISLFPDSDGTVRRLPLAARTGAEAPFAFQLASVAGRRVVTDTLPQPFMIDFRPQLKDGRLQRDDLVPTVSAHRLLTEPDAVDLRGKTVLIGLTAQGAHDFHNTPVMPGVPGVYLHAFVLRSLLFADNVMTPHSSGVAISVVLFAVLCAAAMFTVRPWVAAVGGMVTALAFAAWAGGQFVRHGTWIPMAPYLAVLVLSFTGGLIYAHRVVDREERRVRRMFRRYVAPAVVDELLDNALGTDEGRPVTVTVMFADIRGFTAYAEHVSPDDAMATLDTYLQVMGATVLESGGTLDKYIGDAVMAVFGAPVPNSRHAIVAWETAVQLQRVVNELCAAGQTLRVGIGLHSGEVVAGSIGTTERREYTVIGDVVNVASRLENIARPGEIVYSEETRQLLSTGDGGTEAVAESVTINPGRTLAVYRVVAGDF